MLNRHLLIALTAALGLTMLCACAGQPENQPSPMDKWREMAQKSKGYSPSARQRKLDLPPKKIETIAPGQTAATPSRPLPRRSITMTMHQTDVAVLLRALARAVNLNIMINESVSGKISINVTNARWDQVFMGILNSQGLAYDWEGDIIRIITFEDRARNLKNLEAEEKIEAKKRELEMQAPLVTKIIPIDFASAEKLKESVEKILTVNKPGEPTGSVVVNTHTNSLIVQATPVDLERIVPLITELDRPTSQVLIEAHIVETTTRTARELGVQWGGLYYNSSHNYWIVPGATGAVSDATLGSGSIDPSASTAVNFPANLSNANQSGTGFNLGIISEMGDRILAFELSALEEEGKLNILSSPSITTLDNIKATIESGREIPIQTVANENVSITYKSAVLSLEVTPHVIQDNALKLEILTTKDEIDTSVEVANGNPAILTKKASTNVILFDGQTTVIGGLKKTNSQNSEAGVPWLWKIPGLGHLFKNQSRLEQMEEILIFITPHILKSRPQAAEQIPEGTAPDK